jgi:RES domain-containing protein
MIVYRITTEKWANQLRGSGYAARWNSKGSFVIYTASTRALACLENLVHRSGEGLNKVFKVVEINIPGSLTIAPVTQNQLNKDWTVRENYHQTRNIGDMWLKEKKSPILKVPSAIIPEEINYLINPEHPDFQKISIKRISGFLFDNRLT